MKRFLIPLLLPFALALAACNGETPDTATPPDDTVEAPATATETAAATLTLADVIAHPRRGDDAARDEYRNPAATLDFFDIGPGQTVAEIWPGWYTPILAPYLADNDGAYVAVLFPDDVSERIAERNAAFRERFADTDEFGDIAYGTFSGDTGLSLETGSVDTILTFRNVHNWMGGGYAEDAFAEFYRTLKPGGMLGVVEHRLPETRTQDPNGATGYVQESYMKALAEEAGFEFVASSEVNANPLDTADHPLGVWTLPPRSRVPEDGTPEANGFDAELYRNIGESDRATLKFRKPE
ncbi:methyltransferase domain-containing protein [uncultured Algimonas sp.]|uniref:class I SAM-dependent methyltransferase n=1 Tax=uncultured Algimonas sp. TaxID=1547920 RepID=UPI00260A7F2A|nr:methyltransferase domain-containing protein [uncultured Algimonas sp.]